MGKVIGVLSLKGGVGKTSAVISLGCAFAELGKKVLLIDGNFSAPNLGIHLKIINPDITIHHVLSNLESINDSIIKLENFNFDIIPASVFYKDQINFFKLKDKIKYLKRKYDFIILDSSPSMNDETLAVMLASDQLFIVTTPDYPTLSMTIKAVKDAKSRGIKVDGLILNKVYNKSFELKISEIEDSADLPVLAVIPEDINIVKSLSNFVPLMIQNPRSKGSIEYKKLAGVIIGEKYKPRGLRNFFRITPKRQDINREIFYERVFD